MLINMNGTELYKLFNQLNEIAHRWVSLVVCIFDIDDELDWSPNVRLTPQPNGKFQFVLRNSKTHVVSVISDIDYDIVFAQDDTPFEKLITRMKYMDQMKAVSNNLNSSISDISTQMRRGIIDADKLNKALTLSGEKRQRYVQGLIGEWVDEHGPK